MTMDERSKHPTQGQTEQAACAGARGALHSYAGRNPQGKETVAKVLVVIIQGRALVLYAVGMRELVEKRMQTLRGIFKTYAFQQPAAPPGGAARVYTSPPLAPLPLGSPRG